MAIYPGGFFCTDTGTAIQQQQSQYQNLLGQMNGYIGSAGIGQGLYSQNTISISYDDWFKEQRREKQKQKSEKGFLSSLRKEIEDWHGDILQAA